MQERQQLVRSIEQEIQEYEERHRTLALKADPRMEMLEKIKPQVYKACSWLEQNRNLFQVISLEKRFLNLSRFSNYVV